MKKLLLLLVTCFLSFGAIYAQTVVSGTVSGSENGDPLEGVAVVVKNTTVGVLTGEDGSFRLRVPANGQVLIFTYVGMKKTEVAIGGRSTIDVAMDPDILELEEVVVTAFGIEREERSLTSAIQDVDGGALAQSRETNVVSALSGKVAGVQIVSSNGTPGAAASITIRGNASITGSNQPLFVIDGVIMDNSMTSNTGDVFSVLGGAGFSNRAVDINPEDVEDISVLKGPAATALYGSRAQNGAIVIRTKRGGSGKKGLNVSYSTSVSFDEVNKLPELNQTYAQGFSDSYIQNFSNSWGPKISEMGYLKGATDEESEQNRHDGILVPLNDPSSAGPASVFDRYDFFQTGIKWDQNLTASVGDPNTNALISYNRTDQTGIIPNSSFERNSVRLVGELALSEKIKTSASITYTNTQNLSPQGGSNVNGVMLGLLRTPPSFDNSNGVEDPTDPVAYIRPDGTQRNYRGGGGYDNPYWTANQIPFTSAVNRVTGFVSAKWKPLSWLDLTYRVSTDAYSDFRKQQFAIGSSGTFASGAIYENAIRNYEINSDIFVTLSHDFSEDFSGSLLVGNNLNHRYFQNLFTQGTTLTIPDFYNISNAAAVVSTEYNQTVRLASLFADAGIEFRRMLFLRVTARNDWASTFSEENNSFFYPSASLGFVFTEALGMSDSRILPFGKIRASYAISGSEPGPYNLSTPYVGGTAGTYIGGGFIDFQTSAAGGTPYFTYGDVIGNPDLRPEQTTGIELGADLRFLDGRLGIDYTYYRQRSKDQLIFVNLPYSTGFSSVYQNAATVDNNGHEIVLNINPVRSKNFRWDLNVNFTRNVSEVVSLAEGLDFVSIGANFTSISTRAITGQPYGVFFAGVFETASDGRYVIDDATGFPVISPSQDIVGDPNPDWLMGIGNTLSLKGLSLYFLLDIRKGGDIWNGTLGALKYFGAAAVTEQDRLNNSVAIFDGVLESSYDGNEDNPNEWVANNIAVPLDQGWYRLGPGSGFSGPSVQEIEDGSWFRLRELTLSYAFPSDLLAKTFLEGLEINFTGRNLFLQTNYSGVDPETNLRGTRNVQGWDYFNQPGTRSYVVGLRIKL